MTDAPAGTENGYCNCGFCANNRNNFRFVDYPLGMTFEFLPSHFSSFIFLQTSLVCPVFESMTVVTGRQLQVTVLAFSCLTTTQCSMSSARGGGS